MSDELYLSRLRFSLRDPTAQRILSDLYRLHRLIMSAFPTPSGRVLFRVEPEARNSEIAHVLVQGETRPVWSASQLPPGSAADAAKELRTTFEPGRRFRFRVLANPTLKKSAGQGKQGKRLGVATEDAQRSWFARKAGDGGFALVGILNIDNGNIESRKGEKTLTFRSVRFEGVLEVKEPGLFSAALRNGLGSAKGMGFGLLSLAPL
jgi:CRISPR system Cascade subunit CasE